MSLGDRERTFIEANPSAAMITVKADGVAKPARVAVAVVGDRLWSSGTRGRVRTARLRRDARCTLFVFAAEFQWLALETTVDIIEGPDAADANLALFRQVQGKPTGPLSWFGQELDEDEFLRAMTDEDRVIYDFTVQRAYGMY